MKVLSVLLGLIAFVLVACGNEAAPPPLPPTPSTPDLVGRWSGDGNADDTVGGNHGTLTGGATFSTGKAGRAFSLDGINDSVNLGNAPNLHVSAGDYTVAVWVYFNALSHPCCGSSVGATQGDMSIVDKMSFNREANSDGWRLFKQNDNHFWFCLGGLKTNGCTPRGLTTVRSITQAGVGVWFHVTAVKGSKTISIYVNGALEAMKSLTAFTDTHSANLLIGSNKYEGAHFSGLVDEVEIFNYALSDAEIKAIYETGSAGKAKP